MRIQDTGHSIPRGHRSSLSKEQSFEAGTPNLQYDEGGYWGGGGAGTGKMSKRDEEDQGRPSPRKWHTLGTW